MIGKTKEWIAKCTRETSNGTNGTDAFFVLSTSQLKSAFSPMNLAQPLSNMVTEWGENAINLDKIGLLNIPKLVSFCLSLTSCVDSISQSIVY